MNRMYAGVGLRFEGVPRASGDEPAAGTDYDPLDQCSPRQRG